MSLCITGAIGIIERHKPIIFIEVCEYTYKKAGTSIQDFVEFMHNRDYVLFDEISLRPILNYDSLIKFIPNLNENSTNVICIHKSKIESPVQ